MAGPIGPDVTPNRGLPKTAAILVPWSETRAAPGLERCGTYRGLAIARRTVALAPRLGSGRVP